MPDRNNDNIVPFSRAPAYWVRRARKHQNGDRLQEASVLLRKAYRQTGDEKIALELAGLYCQMGSYSAARRLSEELLSRDASCAGAYYILGVASLAFDDERLADDALATCMIRDRDGLYAEKAQDLLSDYVWRQDPVFPRSARAEVLHLQALDSLWDGDWKKAERLLLRAVRQGKRPQADTLLGENYLRQGRVREALPLLQRAARKLPGRPTQRLLLAQALCAAGARGLAEAWLMKTLPLCESIPELVLAAESCLYAGLKGPFLRRLREVSHEMPLSNDLLYLKAAVYADTFDFERAVRLMMLILKRDPDDPDAADALRTLGLSPVPLDRRQVSPFVYSLCARPPIRGDAALKRLAHGLTISLGGAMSWPSVLKWTESGWARLNPTQKKYLDRDSFFTWQQAFYLWLREKSGDRYLSRVSPLFKGHTRARRVRRMLRFLRSQENWRRIK